MNHQCGTFMKMVWLVSGLLFLWGCDNTAKPPAQSKLVRQKVSVVSSKTVGQKIVLDKQKPVNSILPKPTLPSARKLPPKTLAGQTAGDKGVKMVAMIPLKSEPENRYDPKNKIDPFAPLFQTEPDQPVVPKRKKKRRQPTTPLEKIDLSQLKLTAIIRGPQGNKAMLEETSGKGYWIEKGTYIGRHGGRVTAVLNDRIRILEEIETILGELKTRFSEITLPKPSGEK
jgi:type IV pilus assembly protein PilP